MTSRKDRGIRRGMYALAMPGRPMSVALSFSDERWSRLYARVPVVEDSTRLRADVEKCCNAFLVDARSAEIGTQTLDAIRRQGGKQAALIDRLIKQLLAVEDTLKQIGEIADDSLGEFSNWIQTGRNDVERRKGVFLEASMKPANARREFVRQLSAACIANGLRPTATGRVYQAASGDAHWFQQFVKALNDSLLGEYGWGAEGRYSDAALYAEVAKALSNPKSPTQK